MYLSKHDVDDDTEDVWITMEPIQKTQHTMPTLLYWTNTINYRPLWKSLRQDSNSFLRPLPTPTTSTKNGRRYNKQRKEIRHAYERELEH